MKILKETSFDYSSALVDFINNNKIKRKDIQIITETLHHAVLFYWAENKEKA